VKRYDRRGAAVYALRYFAKYNPDWPSFSGSDCTNFVSQALYAGGWSMVHAMPWAWTAWFSGKAGSGQNYHSKTWTVAFDFSKYLACSGRAKRCAKSELAMGDVVQLRDYDRIHHTMLVTGILPDSMKRNMAFVTFHTYDKAQKPLAAIFADEFMCWKILDNFSE
jgi:hypothetical protein